MTPAEIGLVGGVILGLGAPAVVAGLIAFGTRPPPAPMTAISRPFASVDYSDLPAPRTLTARDGTALAFRHYRGSGRHTVLALHGSSTDGRSLHVLARALAHAGMDVYVPDIRGHGASGRRGDIDRMDQLEDDIADFIAHIADSAPDAKLTVLGFSSGGGLALRYTGRRPTPEIDRLVMIAPMLGIDSPPCTQDNPHAVGERWSRPFVPRIVGLTIFNKFGVHRFDGLPTIAFAVDPDNDRAVRAYSHRLLTSLNPRDYKALLAATEVPVSVLAGTRDQVFAAAYYEPAVREPRPDAEVRLVDGVDHVGMTLDGRALQAVVETVTTDT